LDEALLTWIAAIESGFARDGEWAAWADRQITQLDEPPLWVLNVCVAYTPKKALHALWPAWGTIAQEVWTRLDLTGLRLGFMYLDYERNGISLLAMLLKAGELTDGTNYRVGCEVFYMLANEIRGNGPMLSSPRPLVERVAELFRPFSDSARYRWSRLQGEPGAAHG
jgi:hypothetical protein